MNLPYMHHLMCAFLFNLFLLISGQLGSVEITFSFVNSLPKGQWRGLVETPSKKGLVTPLLSTQNPTAFITVESEPGPYTVTFFVKNAESTTVSLGCCVISNTANPQTISLVAPTRVYRDGTELSFSSELKIPESKTNVIAEKTPPGSLKKLVNNAYKSKLVKQVALNDEQTATFHFYGNDRIRSFKFKNFLKKPMHKSHFSFDNALHFIHHFNATAQVSKTIKNTGQLLGTLIAKSQINTMQADNLDFSNSGEQKINIRDLRDSIDQKNTAPIIPIKTEKSLPDSMGVPSEHIDRVQNEVKPVSVPMIPAPAPTVEPVKEEVKKTNEKTDDESSDGGYCDYLIQKNPDYVPMEHVDVNQHACHVCEDTQKIEYADDEIQIERDPNYVPVHEEPGMVLRAEPATTKAVEYSDEMIEKFEVVPAEDKTEEPKEKLEEVSKIEPAKLTEEQENIFFEEPFLQFMEEEAATAKATIAEESKECPEEDSEYCDYLIQRANP